MNRTKKLIGMGLGLAVLITSMGLAFAADGQLQASQDTARPGTKKVEQLKGKQFQQRGFNFGGHGQNVNILEELVKAGTITADQQKAVQEALKPERKAVKPEPAEPETKGTIKSKLDALVTAGTITQVQEDAIIKAFDDAKAKVQAEMDKRLAELAEKKGITVDELKAQMEKQKAERTEKFGEKIKRDNKEQTK